MRILPASVTAGLTFERTICLERYPAGVWALSAVLRGPGALNLSSTAEATQHKISVDAVTTSGWVPGRYSYSVRVTNGVFVHEVEAGALDILPDLNAQTPGHDGRSHAERTLDAIEAVLERRATLDQERYRINNRELYRTPIAELIKLRSLYRSEVQRERQRARGDKLFGRAVRVIL